METRLEGIVHASRHYPGCHAAIECSDGRVWVIDYEEQSPFHAFAGRQVVAFGEPYQPGMEAHLIGWGDGRQVGHFRVATMRPVEVTPDLQLLEVGPGHRLRGRFGQRASDSGEPMLVFVTEKGDSFLVANDPAGATVGRVVEVRGYPVQCSPSSSRPPGRYLWIICPYTYEDLWKWRERHSR